MPGIKIITDSTADLGQELKERYRLEVVPLMVTFDEETYGDGVDINTQRLFELVKEKGKLPKTSSPSPATFKSVFGKAIADGSQAIYIGISSQFSAAVQNARLAADTFPEGQVHVFDSANLSTGIAQLVLYAHDLAAEGKTAGKIMGLLEKARPRVKTCFMIDTLEYLHMGGRCTGVQALLTSVLKVRPVIEVVDGGMRVAAKIRGSRTKLLDWQLERFAKDVEQNLVKPVRVFLTHTGVHEDAMYMAERVRRIMPEMREILETPAGSVVGSHCGPGTIGILYMLK
ncbi:MAG: DegV family protein [Bacillota bacterium]|jgi:DegV family protein with EDD domain|nr:DegV family protein [Bacillota bacterium]NLH88616.1 DegV family protein [Bacillota bacterium]